MHKFIPIRTETLVVAPAVDLRFNFHVKFIGKVVDTEGFKPVLRLMLFLHLVTFMANFDSEKTLYIYKVR